MLRVYEVDFLPVEAEGPPSSKSGDAIAMRFTDASGNERVVVVDAGYGPVGQEVVDHINKYYDTNHVDLVISTHPDRDHLNGLKTVIEEMTVDRLLIHRPRLHAPDVSDFTNLEAVDDLIETAEAHGTVIEEPFAGMVMFGGHLAILGPTEDLYERKLAEHLAEEAHEKKDLVAALAKRLSHTITAGADLIKSVLPFYPAETLGEDGVTSARNETSVVTVVACDDRILLFTGDAGLEGLAAAADLYEDLLGPFSEYPLAMLQVPHHGSRRNLSPSLLDRIIGTKNAPFATTSAIVSSAKADPKHPSSKVTNALGRRGATVVATEGRTIMHSWNSPGRDGWGPVAPVPPAVEDSDG